MASEPLRLLSLGAARPPDPRRCRTCANRIDSPYHRNVCQAGPRTVDDPPENP